MTAMNTVHKFIKKLLFTFLFTTSVIIGNAQSDTATTLPNFLFPRFIQSSVLFKSGELKSAVLNYNLLDEELIFLQDDTYMQLNDVSVIDTVFVGGRKFIPVNKSVFYEVMPISKGVASFFVQHKSYLEFVGTSTAYGVKSHAATPQYKRQFYGSTATADLSIPESFKVVSAPEYWISKDGAMTKFSSKRQFLKIFKDKEKEVSKYIDENSLTFKTSVDIAKAVAYCNSLYK